MGKRKKQPQGRRHFVAMLLAALAFVSKLDSVLNLIERVRRWFPSSPAPVVVAASGTAAGSSTATAIGSVVLTAETGQLVLTGYEVKLEIGRA